MSFIIIRQSKVSAENPVKLKVFNQKPEKFENKKCLQPKEHICYYFPLSMGS